MSPYSQSPNPTLEIVFNDVTVNRKSWYYCIHFQNLYCRSYLDPPLAILDLVSFCLAEQLMTRCGEKNRKKILMVMPAIAPLILAMAALVAAFAPELWVSHVGYIALRGLSIFSNAIAWCVDHYPTLITTN